MDFFHNIIVKSPNLKLPSIKLSVWNDVIKKTLLFDSEKLTVNNLSVDKLKCKVCLFSGKSDVFIPRSFNATAYRPTHCKKRGW